MARDKDGPEDTELVRSGVRAQDSYLWGWKALLCPKLPSDGLTQHQGCREWGGDTLSTRQILQSYLAGPPLVQA